MPEPPAAYGPTRYDSSGTNCSPAANATPATVASARPNSPARTLLRRNIRTSQKYSRSEHAAFTATIHTAGMIRQPRRQLNACVLMGKRPQPQLLLADLPQPRESVRLDDQEEDDEPPEHHQLEIRRQRPRHRHVKRRLQDSVQPLRRHVEADRHQHDERGPEKRAEDAAHAPDDHHEQDPEREIEREAFGLDGAEIRIGV